MSKLYSVYCLLCPLGRVRYIGITYVTPNIRLSGHISDTKRKRFDHKTNWIRGLIKSGNTPTMRIVKSGLKQERAEFIEKLLIKLLRRPFSLVNSHEGGSTGFSGLTNESKAKHRASMQRLGGKNLKTANHKEAQRKAAESHRANILERGPNQETTYRRILDDCRGMVIHRGVTYSSLNPEGKEWSVIRSKMGATNQVDVVIGGSILSTCGLRSVERALKRSKF